MIGDRAVTVRAQQDVTQIRRWCLWHDHDGLFDRDRVVGIYMMSRSSMLLALIF